MINAKVELVQHITDIKNAFNIRIKCAECFSVNTDDVLEIYMLPINHTLDDCDKFINLFDFEYIDMVEYTEDMILTGTIWWSDGSWSTREVYAEFESWVFYRAPDIPRILKRCTNNNVINLFSE